jgi:hypothetical protein
MMRPLQPQEMQRSTNHALSNRRLQRSISKVISNRKLQSSSGKVKPSTELCRGASVAAINRYRAVLLTIRYI